VIQTGARLIRLALPARSSGRSPKDRFASNSISNFHLSDNIAVVSERLKTFQGARHGSA